MNATDRFSKAVDDKATELFTRQEWTNRRKAYEKTGLDNTFCDMQRHTLDAVYNDDPTLFQDYQWINSDDGLPLWVRPGVEWVCDNDLND